MKASDIWFFNKKLTVKTDLFGFKKIYIKKQ
jgi:hypothetical protein